MLNGLEIAIIALILWILALMALGPRLAKTKNLQAYGPFLMIKATKNRGVLDKFSKPSKRNIFSKVSVALVLIFLVLGTALITYESYLATQVRGVSLPGLQYYLVLPGINPAIPLFYGAFALIFCVAIHEAMHGVVARKHGLPLKSVGVLFIIIPAGAFVEPEQEAMEAADPIVRRRVIAAGPSVNILIAIALFLILVFLMMPSVHPLDPGMYVQQVDATSPASSVIGPGSEIVAFGNYTGNDIASELTSSTIVPGTLVNTTIRTGNTTSTEIVPAGLVVDSTTSGYPANASGIKVGGILYSVEGQIIYNETSLSDVLDAIAPNTNVSVTMYYFTSDSTGVYSKSVENYTVTTASKYDFYQKYEPGYNSEAYKNQSFLGITSSYLGVGGYSMQYAQTIIFGGGAIYGGESGAFTTLALPFVGLSPVPGSLASLFATPFYAPAFWFLTNLFFWVFWLSFLLGLVNALPIFITDGSQFLRDSLLIWGKKRNLKSLSDERKASTITNILGLIIVFLIFWELIVPRIL